MKKRVCKILIIMLIISNVFNTAIVWASTDTDGPKVSNISITPNEVDMGDYVTVSAEISDISGVNQNVSVQICSSAGNVAGGILERISGDEYNGVYEGTYQIPTRYSAGEWHATIYANDIYGNFGGFNTVYFTVNGYVDTDGPKVSNISITPNEVDMGDYVTVSAEISDISGVNQNVSVQICSSAGNVAGGILERVSGDEYNGVYEGTYQIPTRYSAGEWHATIYANDIYGNFGGFNTVYFTVNGYVDTDGPKVSNISITPNEVDMGDYVTVSAEISDISGVNQNVSVQICSSAGNVAGGILERVSGDEYNGVYEGTYQIPTRYSAGEWHATIYANDIYGNFGGFNTVYFIVNDKIVHIHKGTKVNQIDSTCASYGVKAYYICSCGKFFCDSECKNEILDFDSWKIEDGKILKKSHIEVVDKAVSPTCTENGKTEGKHCLVCEKVTVVQKDVDALNHDFGTNKEKCIRCGKKNPKYKADDKQDNSQEVLSQKKQTISTAKMKIYKASSLKKKAISFSLKAKASGKTKLTYKVTKYPKNAKKYITVSKSGKVTLKKKAKKGTYKITIKAAASKKYKAVSKVITIKVK